jgi:hypothetical protein
MVWNFPIVSELKTCQILEHFGFRFSHIAGGITKCTWFCPPRPGWLTHTLTYTHTHTHTFIHSHTHTHTHSLTHKYIHTLICTRTHRDSLSLSHTHTHAPHILKCQYSEVDAGDFCFTPFSSPVLWVPALQ